MARIRSVKPELRTSLTVASWPREVRYAWVLLWGYLDDYGRGVDDLRLLVADMFPLDRDVTERKLNNWLARFCEKPDDPEKPPPLCRYEVQGRAYMHATNWPEHQKPAHPTDSRIPPCPTHESLVKDSRNARESVQEPIANSSGGDRERFSASRVGGAGSREQGAGEVLAPSGAARARDELFEAVVEVCRIDTASLTKAGRGPLNGALSQLREVEATPGQVKVRAQRYRQQYPTMNLTPSALVKHWGSLAPTTSSGTDRPVGWEFGGA